MAAIFLLGFAVSVSQATAQSVNLFPPGNSSALAEVLGVTSSCLDALNTTVKCDSGTFQWLNMVDQYMWSPSNITALCTSACESSLSDWNTAVDSACNGQEVIHYTQLVPASTIPGLLQYHYSIACLQSSTGDSCMIESQNWQGSDVIRWDRDSCNTGNATYDNPACFDGNFTLSEITPAQELLSNLYNQSMLCSDCFVKMMYQRLVNPYLPDADFSDYLVQQFDDIQQVCSTSMALTTRALPTYSNVSTTVTATATATTLGNATVPTCSGQVIPTVSPALSCDELSQKYGVTTGDLVVATQDWDCGITGPLCLPTNCTVDFIPFGETCDSLIQRYSSVSGTTITSNQFMTWNKNILGLCDDLQGYQYVCSNPPGGQYAMPSVVIAAPTATSVYYTTATPSQPTPSGTTAGCGLFYNVVAGDDCQVVCLKNGITFPQFQALNPEIDSNCTNLWLNYAYCVANVTTGPISTDGTCGPNSPSGATCANAAMALDIVTMVTAFLDLALTRLLQLAAVGLQTTTTTARQDTAAVRQGIAETPLITAGQEIAIMVLVIQTTAVLV
ncbi:hypothetical protein ZTR_09536 [Talaromyces verruculosus]|nr:hypothetical protein ZTR_09536 [Talaromyces verruculosus]